MTAPNGPNDLKSDIALSDARNIARTLSGDAAGFTAIVTDYQQIVYRWALSLAADPDDADDVVQETFVIAYRKLGGYDGRAALSSWLYSIARRAARQRRRSASRRRAILERSAGWPDPVYLTDPGARVDRASALALIRVSFRGLPRKQREIFDLVDIQGLTPSEAAELTRTKAATVRANLFKARAKIRAEILSRHPRYEI